MTEQSSLGPTLTNLEINVVRIVGEVSSRSDNVLISVGRSSVVVVFCQDASW